MLIQLSAEKAITGFGVEENQYTIHANSSETKKAIATFLMSQLESGYILVNPAIEDNVLILVGESLNDLLDDLKVGGYCSEEDVGAIQNNTELQAKLKESAEEAAALATALKDLVVEEDDSDDETAGPDDGQERFESFEHASIGHRAFNALVEENPELRELLEGLIDAEETTLGRSWHVTLPRGAKVPVGHIVALAGDFFGVAKAPIAHAGSDPERTVRFLRAYATLEHAPKAEIDGLVKVFDREARAVKKAQASGKPTNEELAKLNRLHAQDARYTKLTKGRYVKLAVRNFDHFGDDAKAAYRVGHTLAMQLASIAKGHEEGSDLQKQTLLRALCYEAYAGHFLTDLFASGHMRTPRKMLSEHLHQQSVSFFAETRAGYRSYKMHNEDNKKGLNVTSERHPEGWRAYGDGLLHESQSEDNFKYVVEAMTDGFGDVYAAFENPEAAFQYSYEEHLPQVSEDNHAPMYWVEDGQLKERSDAPKELPSESAPRPMDRLHAWTVKHLPSIFKGADKVTPDEHGKLEAAYASLEDDPDSTCCFR